MKKVLQQLSDGATPYKVSSDVLSKFTYDFVIFILKDIILFECSVRITNILKADERVNIKGKRLNYFSPMFHFYTP